MMTIRRERSFRPLVVVMVLSFGWVGETYSWMHIQCRPSAMGTIRVSPQKAIFHQAAVTTCCNLFTRPINYISAQPLDRNVQYENLIGTDLPWTLELQGNTLDTINRDKLHESSSTTLPTTKLSIRLMQFKDIDSIITMNVREYGPGPAYFPWSNLALMEAWIDRQYIRWLVDITCRMKLFNYLMDDNSSFTTSTPEVNDHAILVGILNDDSELDDERIIVGMIEVSLQPLNPQITPSPIPIPIDVKRALASITTRSSLLVGWITNLLIVPQYRGCGYSKILVAASEHIAKSGWNCTSIHLHCDADPISGMVPQKLYTKLGYRSPTPECETTSRMVRLQSNVDSLPYVVEIEGVPLLYLYKEI